MNGLLFITHQTEKYGYLPSVEIALRGGCRSIQLRMKDAAPEETERTARAAKELCDSCGAELYIDDHVEICGRIGATGVHLGKCDMSPLRARKLLGDGFVIGGTANTFEDMVRLHEEGVDYVGLGPFRFTDTKKNLSPLLGLAGYRRIIRQCKAANIRLPVIAIGGIAAADVPAIIRAGVAGIALSSAVMRAADPVEETKKIIRLIDSCRPPE
ncbi:MAG: thiamine phosphate synthase [Bacteroidales bacterium]|jgi:thiamine-phosphate pyrophosphorylase|nr:thiamine phosphate synthase [Bacteroidales bacterium]